MASQSPEENEDIRSQDNEGLNILSLPTFPISAHTDPAPLVLKKVWEQWRSSRLEWEAEGNEQDALFARKVETVCEILLKLINQNIRLTTAQQGLIQDMIHTLAGSLETFTLKDGGETALVTLPLATYINSCSY